MEATIRVTVTPSQSSYFAGEPFSVLITFTNTRSPDLGPSKPSSRSHKRGAHSVSLAPIARPPTSPGPPRTPTSALPVVSNTRFSEPRPARKGFIGKQHEPPQPNGSAALPDLIEQRRRKLLAKSQSVSISPTDLEEALGEAAFPRRSDTDPSQCTALLLSYDHCQFI
jgi:RAB6A-GEF complex partner protein 2